MTVLRGDCVEVMAGMEPDSIDAIVTDPPYGLEFMGKEWDALDTPGWRAGTGGTGKADPRNGVPFGGGGKRVRYGAGLQTEWHAQWAAAALRVAKPGAYLLAFGGTRTVHRMTTALEDAGWVIRDMLIWGYAQGFPKSKASLKPAWEPIVLARKPGPLRELNIDAARIGTTRDVPASLSKNKVAHTYGGGLVGVERDLDPNVGRWPANVILTDPILDGGWEGVVGGGWQKSAGGGRVLRDSGSRSLEYRHGASERVLPADVEGTYSRFFLIPKAPTSERVLSDGRRSPHPTQKPEALIRHLVTLVTPKDGIVLDPFLGSGTLGVVCDGLGMRWVGIEREAEYADWAEDRIRYGRPLWDVAP